MIAGNTRTLSGRYRAVLIAAALAALMLSSTANARVYTLDECVDTALANNITLARAEESLEGAGSDVLSSWSGVLPRVSGDLGYGDNLRVASGAETSSNGYSAGLTASQTLFNGATFASISGAHHSMNAVRLSLDSTRRDVVFETKQAYYGLLKAEQLRDVASESLELTREQLRKTESLFELGSASRSDLLKAQVQVKQAELSLISSDSNFQLARAGLAYTLGIDVTTDIEAVEPDAPEVEDILEYDLESALSRRPDVQAWEENVVAARRSLLAAKAERWPDLGVSVSYSRGADGFGDLFDDMKDEYSRTVSVGMSVPIFNGLQTKARIDGSKSTLRTYELSLRDARLSASYEIETARLSVVQQRESVVVAETAVAQAEEDLRVSEERYRLRAASMLELIDSRVAYSSARATLVEAKYDYEIAKAELTKALGL